MIIMLFSYIFSGIFKQITIRETELRERFTQMQKLIGNKTEPQRIKNPLIILIGIKFYEVSNNINCAPTDIKMMYNLFKNHYKYEHVYSINGDEKYRYNADQVMDYLRRIQNICNDITGIAFDGIGIYYTGHGAKNM